MHSLCRVDAASGAVEVLSPPDAFVSSINVLSNGQGIAYVSSTLESAPEIAFAPIAQGKSAPAATFAPPMDIDVSKCAELRYGTADNGAQGVLHYKLRVPQGMAPEGGWPLMLYVYGGPHVQLVRKDFAARCELLPETLCAMGIAVASTRSPAVTKS